METEGLSEFMKGAKGIPTKGESHEFQCSDMMRKDLEGGHGMSTGFDLTVDMMAMTLGGGYHKSEGWITNYPDMMQRTLGGDYNKGKGYIIAKCRRC